MLEAIGSILTGGANVGAAIGQYSLGKSAQDIDLQNLQFQKDLQSYNQALQKQIFAREDSSVQRRVADLKAAGLSPVLAAGQGARAGEAIKIQAPQQEVRGIGLKMAALGSFSEISRTIMDTLATASQIDKTKAETDQISQTTPQIVELNTQKIEEAINKNKILSNTIDWEIESIRSKTRTQLLEEEIRQYEKNTAGIDYHYKEDLKRWIEKQGNFSPLQLEYLTNKIAYDINVYDKKFWQNLGLPKGGLGISNAAGSVASSIGQSIAKFLRDEYRKLTGR